jgi:FKBP-type peptidyl-prolyl cis-trans isomerase FkpA
MTLIRLRQAASILLSLVLVLAVSPAGAGEPALDTEESRTLYVLGRSMAQNLASLGLSAEQLPALQAGLADGVLGRPERVPAAAYAPKVQEFARDRMKVMTAREKEAARELLERESEGEGAVRTASGLVYHELTPGQGDSPEGTSKVRVHYHGTLRDGTVFDSSVDRNQPATFALNQVIPCWTEALQRMKVGGKSRLVCPAELAYQDRGAPPHIRPGAALVFEVELLEIME